MKILLAYFSATQNTARIAETIRDRLIELGAEVDMLDITTPEARETAPVMNNYQAVVIGSPIYYRRAPKIVRNWLGRLKGQDTPCALFFTFGGFGVHPAHFSAAGILAPNGFSLVASAEFPGKHTYNLVGWQAMADRPATSDFDVAREYADLIHDRFSGEERLDWAALPLGPCSVEELDQRETSVPKLLPRRPGRDGAECGMCMLCEELCPSGAMDATSGEARADLCVFCLRCMDVCPEKVIGFLDLSELFTKKMEMDGETQDSLRAKTSKIYK